MSFGAELQAFCGNCDFGTRSKGVLGSVGLGSSSQGIIVDTVQKDLTGVPHTSPFKERDGHRQPQARVVAA